MSAVPLGRPSRRCTARSPARRRRSTTSRAGRTWSGRNRSPTPGSLRAWCLALDRYGTMSLADVMQPAIRHASARLRRHALSLRLHRRVPSPDLLQDPFAADRLLPDGDAAEARRAPGAGRLRRGADPDLPAGRERAARRAARRPRWSSAWSGPAASSARKDLTDYRVVERTPIRGQLSRLGDRRPAAARRLGRAYHADAEHPRRLRHRRAGLRHGRRRSICWPRC